MKAFLRRLIRDERGDVLQWVVILILALGFTVFVMGTITDSEDDNSPAKQLVNWVKHTVSCMTRQQPLGEGGFTSCQPPEAD